MIVEVSDTTLDYDRDVKLSLYARHGMPEVWIVDLDTGLLRVCRAPQAERYADEQTLDAPGVLTPQLLPELAIDLTGILA